MPEGDHITQDPVGALFTTEASDNAEIVPPTGRAGPEQMWSTAANAVEAEDPVDGELVDDDDTTGTAGSRTGAGRSHVPPYRPPVADRVEGIFSSEPVPRSDDVVDEDDAGVDPDLDQAPFGTEAGVRTAGSATRPSTSTGAPLFSSTRTVPTAPNPWVDTNGSGEARATRSPFAPTSEPPPPRPNGHRGPAAPGNGRRPGPTGPPPSPPSPPRSGGVGLDGHGGAGEGPDPNGLRAAISRLHPGEVERAAVPIAVCGALLNPDERVLGAVTGQMLGRPAVIVVSESRVLVVNDRRWQPIVDEFHIDSTLVVRGRHDRNVAALSFADPRRLAMVDGITEVALAIELAERIRDAGSA